MNQLPRHRIRTAVLVSSLLALAAPLVAQHGPAEPNDHRKVDGLYVNGELRFEFEAVEGEWYPRGPDGPRIMTPMFAVAGHAPQIPGPLIRVPVGTPVRVTVLNRLDRTIEVRGLLDREPVESAGIVPAFARAAPMVVLPGERQTVSFIANQAVSSIYYGRVRPRPGERGTGVPMEFPGGLADEGAFMGALIVDEQEPHPDERVMMITRWGSPEEPGSLNPSWKLFMNGRSWPYTERIETTVGETVRWRIINASLVDHPMHLHGFYYSVLGVGDGQTDTVYDPADRRMVVTETMQEISSLRLEWVPERPGNWLFHCHLIRHMGDQQRFEVDRMADGGSGPANHLDAMAGLVMGITVRPRTGDAEADPPPQRRIDLWTGRENGVFGDRPQLGFVMQEGGIPVLDSAVVPGSPLVLTQGESTEITIHNRLYFPLSVHWHGLELRSLYDGVADWSGTPQMPRPPIQPGAVQRVVIEPVRAGTFMYHTHGEPGSELTQGLYGPLIVLPPDTPWDPEHDRVFMLSSHGAELDSPAAVNGRTDPALERFEPGESYRLRFAHISADAYKRVRLLRNESPVEWQPWAKDGADLPASRRVAGTAEFGIGVGEAMDVRWTPDEPGVYVLEITTEYYPSTGGIQIQRVGFAVGSVTDEELQVTLTGTALDIVDMPEAERARYVGTYVGDDDEVVSIWNMPEGLYGALETPGFNGALENFLVHLGGGEFTPGTRRDGLVRTLSPDRRVHFETVGPTPTALEIVDGDELSLRLERVSTYTPDPDALQAFVGRYTSDDILFEAVVEIVDGVLHFGISGPPGPTVALSPTRFTLSSDDGGPPGVVLTFARSGDRRTVRVEAWSSTDH